jgi:chromosome segregation ATPase
MPDYHAPEEKQMWFMRPKQKLQFNIATLKKNDIVILTLDERWNKLFKIIPISAGVKKQQDFLNKLLGQEAGLYQEQKSIEPEKIKQMNRIMMLTEEAFDKNNEEAKKSLSESKDRIESLNKRAQELDNEIYQMKGRIREANFKLLEETVRYVYSVIEKSREKEKKLDSEIEQVKKKLKDLQAERQNLAADWTDVYSFFHTLLGSDELTKLDQLFLKPEEKKDETGNSQ